MEYGQEGESGGIPELARNCEPLACAGPDPASVSTRGEPEYPARPYIAPERFVVQASSDSPRLQRGPSIHNQPEPFLQFPPGNSMQEQSRNNGTEGGRT